MPFWASFSKDQISQGQGKQDGEDLNSSVINKLFIKYAYFKKSLKKSLMLETYRKAHIKAGTQLTKYLWEQ